MTKMNNRDMNLYKLIVVVGPTASGKSDLAVKLAKKFNGAVVSADSRQVYKGMDIGSGKITKKETQGVSHFLLDVASPRQRFSVTRYRKLAMQAILKIQKQARLPILCGGTGFYIQAVVDGISIPEVMPNWKLRRELEKKTAGELFKMLKKLDPKRAKTIEVKNPRRLIRAIEIVKAIGRVPELKKELLPYPVLFIGVKKEKEVLCGLIKKRLLKRLRAGMVQEARKLRKSGISFKKLESFGLEYRAMALFLQNKIDRAQMINQIQKESEHYAKRQMVWFKRDKRINWVGTYGEAIRFANDYLK